LIEKVPLIAYGALYEPCVMFIVIVGVYVLEDKAVQIFVTIRVSDEDLGDF